MRWVLLLRAVNVGGNNRLPMKDLKGLLEGLGYDDVTTYLNSGNATFTANGSAKGHAEAIEAALVQHLDLRVRACVRSTTQIAKAVEEVPELRGYLAVNVLFDKPAPQALRDFLATDWSPEVVQGNDQVLYIAFVSAARTKLTLAKIEKALGVSATARTPETLRKLLT